MNGERRADLSEVSTSALERLRHALLAGTIRTPLTQAALLAFGLRHQLDALHGALAGHSGRACIAVLEVVLAERERHRGPDPELVWTGPERTRSTARDTAVVLRELFESASKQVLLAGFSFTRSHKVLEPLYRVMQQRPVDVRFFIEVPQTDVPIADPDSYAASHVRRFLKESWPYGDPTPRIYYDVRALTKGPPWSSLHAKCVVVDGERAFVTSANFSDRGQERNVEAGVLLHDSKFAEHLARQWIGLIEAGLVRECQLIDRA